MSEIKQEYKDKILQTLSEFINEFVKEDTVEGAETLIDDLSLNLQDVVFDAGLDSECEEPQLISDELKQAAEDYKRLLDSGDF